MGEFLKTDYLVIGSGLVGMAFVDTLLTETDAHIIIVDRYAKPGGHWNVAYPFVTLHQPSSYFGVNSKELSRGEIDQVGLNKGMGDLASGAEVCASPDQKINHFEGVRRTKRGHMQRRAPVLSARIRVPPSLYQHPCYLEMAHPSSDMKRSATFVIQRILIGPSLDEHRGHF